MIAEVWEMFPRVGKIGQMARWSLAKDRKEKGWKSNDIDTYWTWLAYFTLWTKFLFYEWLDIDFLDHLTLVKFIYWPNTSHFVPYLPYSTGFTIIIRLTIISRKWKMRQLASSSKQWGVVAKNWWTVKTNTGSFILIW
jgi:hypothetical protein